MKNVELYRPLTTEEAIGILSAKGAEASIYAGGTDILDRLKSRLGSAPRYLVDIKGIDGLRFVRKTDVGGIEIGALTTLTELLESHAVNSHPLLGEVLRKISSPELRNQSTVGGNLLQEVWCPYLRGNYPCWRNGGSVCYAEVGDNKVYQSVMGASRSFAVHHGDLAPALIALDATADVATPQGRKEITIEELLPGEVEVEGRIQSHSLRKTEILTGIRIPPVPHDAYTAFRKVRYRGVWDFALSSLAILIRLGSAKNVIDSRIVFGAVSTGPLRVRKAEDSIRGQVITSSLAADVAGRTLENPKPLKHNAYKVDMAVGLLYAELEHLASDSGAQT